MTAAALRRSARVKRLLAAPVLLLAAIAIGCGGGDELTAPTVPEPAGGPLVEYTRGGGFAPSVQHLTVEPDGAAVLEAGYEPQKPETTEFSLTDAELEDLTAAVEAADLEAVENGDAICADCFTYEIEAGGQDAQLTDADLMEGSDAVVPLEVLDLMDVLASIVDEQGGVPSIGG